VALILGDSMLASFLIPLLDTHIVPNPSWTSHCMANNAKEINFSVLDSQSSVLYYLAGVSTTVLWSHAIC